MAIRSRKTTAVNRRTVIARHRFFEDGVPAIEIAMVFNIDVNDRVAAFYAGSNGQCAVGLNDYLCVVAAQTILVQIERYVAVDVERFGFFSVLAFEINMVRKPDGLHLIICKRLSQFFQRCNIFRTACACGKRRGRQQAQREREQEQHAYHSFFHGIPRFRPPPRLPRRRLCQGGLAEGEAFCKGALPCVSCAWHILWYVYQHHSRFPRETQVHFKNLRLPVDKGRRHVVR